LAKKHKLTKNFSKDTLLDRGIMKNLNYCWRCGDSLEKKMDEGRERYYCGRCKKFVYRNAVPVAGVFVVKDENKVLLIKRRGEPHKGKWSYPAGYLEYDEKPETGAVRELEEETGVKASEQYLELVATLQLEHPDKYIVGNAYATNHEYTTGEVKPGDDAEDAKFWTIEEMKENVAEMESEKIIGAARKAIRLVGRSS